MVVSSFSVEEKETALENVPAEETEDNDRPRSDSSMDGLCGSSKLWIGKDYCNFIVKDFANLDDPYQGMHM